MIMTTIRLTLSPIAPLHIFSSGDDDDSHKNNDTEDDDNNDYDNDKVSAIIHRTCLSSLLVMTMIAIKTMTLRMMITMIMTTIRLALSPITPLLIFSSGDDDDSHKTMTL